MLDWIKLSFDLRHIGEADHAVQRGREALAAGDGQTARRWLDRSHRLAPDNPSVTLLLASSLAGIDDYRADSLLTALIERQPACREALIALSASRLRSGNVSRATELLGLALSRVAPSADPMFRRFADTVIQAGGEPGWVGFDARGRIHLSTNLVARPTGLQFKLDGRIILPTSDSDGGWRLPRGWTSRSELAVTARGSPLVGSPIDVSSRARVEGFVEVDDFGCIVGWCWLPGDPDFDPVLTVASEALPGSLRIRADDGSRSDPDLDSSIRARHFVVAAARLPVVGSVSVHGPDGGNLLGSPVVVGSEQTAAQAAVARLAKLLDGDSLNATVASLTDPWRPLPVTLAPLAAAGSGAGSRRALPERAAADIIIPVYRGAQDFTACLASLLASLNEGCSDVRSTRIIVVDDASPDPELRSAIQDADAAGEVILLRHARNMGFPSAVNTGLRWSAQHGAPRDIVLLNSDTVVPQRWLERLGDAAYAAPNIGSVTPMTNDGTIVSYPEFDAASASPRGDALDRLDALFQGSCAGQVIDLPTGVGFCMYIRNDCLSEVGNLRTDVFAQGYGEENDWSLRARHLGWRHVVAVDVFVSHTGGRSFGSGKTALRKRNGTILNRLHPGYDVLIRDFIKQDPIRAVRCRIDRERWTAARMGAAVVLITHDLGGGVERHIEERSAALRMQGIRPVVLRPGAPLPNDENARCRISDGTENHYPNLQFTIGAELEELVSLLRGDTVQWVEFHHIIGHSPEMTRLPNLLGVPYDLFIHDAALICPRVTLCGRGGSYCGEPMDIEECELCVLELGRHDRRTGSVTDLRRHSQALLHGARRVVAPCEDAARRIVRYFGPLAIDCVPWEDDHGLAAFVDTPRCAKAQQLRTEQTRICITGAIGEQKGYRVLLACAREAARNGTQISFVVVGSTMDDSPLLETGRVFITGRFEQAEASDLIRAQDADLGWIPSVGPETWCYALSSLWQAGLPVAAFDIGAQRDRIRRTGKGVLLPIGMRAAQINQTLLRHAFESAA